MHFSKKKIVCKIQPWHSLWGSRFPQRRYSWRSLFRMIQVSRDWSGLPNMASIHFAFNSLKKKNCSGSPSSSPLWKTSMNCANVSLHLKQWSFNSVLMSLAPLNDLPLLPWVRTRSVSASRIQVRLGWVILSLKLCLLRHALCPTYPFSLTSALPFWPVFFFI